MRTLAGWRFVTRGRKEKSPATVALGWGMILVALFRHLSASKTKRVMRRRLKPGQGLMIRMAADEQGPPARLRRVR